MSLLNVSLRFVSSPPPSTLSLTLLHPSSPVDIQSSLMDNHVKSSSRFSTLNVFGKFSSKPPRPPPKDQWYRQGSKSTVSLAPSHALSMHAASIASSSHETLQMPQTPISISRSHYDLSRTMSPASTHSHTTTTTTASSTAPSRMSEASSFFSKISSSFGKRPKLFLRSNASRTTLSPAASARISEDGVLVDSPEGDEDISAPWNVQHHLHVDEGLSGLPPEWIDQLRASGLKDADILSTHSRRNRTTYLQHHPDISPDTIRARSPYSPFVPSASQSSFSPTMLPKGSLPTRSTSLRRPAESDDASSVSTTMRSASSGSRSPDSPPSSYDHASRPSLSSMSSRSPSRCTDEIPGTATAANFTAILRPTRPDGPLPRVESTYGDPSLHPSTPSRSATAFRVMNGSPPSPPPAYGSADVARANMQAYIDVKVNPRADSWTSRGYSDFIGERRSEETVTPEVLLRNEDNHDSRSSGRAVQTNSPPQSPNATPTTSSPFRLQLSTPTRDESPSPPISPILRTTVLPPRLSLHQDIDSDLSSWSEALFSVMITSDPKPASEPASSVRTEVPAKLASVTPKKSPVPPLVLSAPSNEHSDIIIEGDQDRAVASTTPLFEEVMSLVQSSSAGLSSTLVDSNQPISTYPYLPSTPAASPSFAQGSHDFHNHRHAANRNSSVSQLSSRNSQATISDSNRWSRATTVRDVRDATIVHVRKTSVANAMTVPAPSKHTQQLSTSTIRPDDLAVDSGPSSAMSSPRSADTPFPSASDFPMPPPSPNDGTSGVNSSQISPLALSFSTESVRASVVAPHINRLPSPASTRSSQSSSGSGSSSSSSQANPLSVTSGSDEGPDEVAGLASTVRVELRYNESESSCLSPIDSESDSKKWDKEEAQHVSITSSVYEDGEAADSLCYDQEDGGSTVVDWLTDTPSPHYELHGTVRRDSDAVYTLLDEPGQHLVTADRSPQIRRPSVQVNGISTSSIDSGVQKYLSPNVSPAPKSAVTSSPSSPSSSPSHLLRYRGWLSEVVAPLEEFIDHTVDPRDLFIDLQEIAVGESGSVYAATVVARSRKFKSANKQTIVDADTPKMVAIKDVRLLPGGSPKLDDLRKELLLVSRIRHEHILSVDGLYVDLVEDSLWIKMELMERSLADVLGLTEEGLTMAENVIALFASDTLNALAHLEDLGIAHRDVRSDNLLVNSQGVLKITDFSHALLVDLAFPMHSDPAGVIYWQAPEVRSGSYDARKVDVWSAGATVWEMAEGEPPFMNIEDPRQLPDRWPALSQPEAYSRSFYDFLSSCSSQPSSRPTAHDLLTTSFIRTACARTLVVDLLDQCKSTEERIHRRQSSDSQGTVSQ